MSLNTQRWGNLKNHYEISQTFFYAHVTNFHHSHVVPLHWWQRQAQ